MKAFIIVFVLCCLLSGLFADWLLYLLLPIAILSAVFYFFKQFFHSAKILKNLYCPSHESDDTMGYENRPIGWATNKDHIYSDTPVESQQQPEFRKYNGAGYLAYQYQCVWFTLCTSNISESFVHKPIEFFRDADGISVRCDSNKIGVLNPHKITDMISDWLDREESYCAYLNTIFTDTMEASFNIAFYRDELANAFRKYDEYKEFKLIGTRSDEISETAELSNEGEKCTVDYDPAHDKYAVYDEYSNIMGFLPSAGAKYYQDHDEECVGFVSRVEYDDFDRHVILYVTLFAK